MRGEHTPELRFGPCAECDGAGEWDEGPLPASSGASEPEYRQVFCPRCDGTGIDLIEVECIELEDTIGVLAPRPGSYGHWHDWNDDPRFSDEPDYIKDMCPDVNWDVVTIRDGKMVVIPYRPGHPFRAEATP